MPLRHRDRRPELMDQPDLSAPRHRHALADLARINWWSRSAGILWPDLARLASELAPRPVRFLDVACGSGDVPVRLALQARRQGVPLHITGRDVSAEAVGFARERAEKAGVADHVTFEVGDALAGPALGDLDAVSASLFLHHLDEADALTLLRRMGAPEGSGPRLVLVNDLDRSLTGLILAQVVTRVLSRSAVVHYDGPVSVRGAFTAEEARDLGHRAGLTGARVVRRWPCRWLLTWRRA